jgi:cyclopropane-fatty-acyl-phospholipid synthase
MEQAGSHPFERGELIGPVPATLLPGRSARRRIERRVLRRLARGLDGVVLREDLGAAARRPTVRSEATGPIEVRILDERAYASTAREGSAGLGEGYFRGWWDTDDLVGALAAMIRAQEDLDATRSKVHEVFRPLLDPLRRWLRRSDLSRDRRNVRAHYDLSNEFFELFLDETMTYSSAVFSAPEVSLADASRAKLERLSAKLGLGPETSVLEIGAGWGSFAMHAAGSRRAPVTTTTISANQAALARKRFAEAGLTEAIELREVDYRELEGRFDRLVSIEMIEAVDWRDSPTFFATCSRLLADDGLMGLQAIVVDDKRWARVRTTQDFIKTWIFPGGNLPSVSSIATEASQAGDLRIIDLEDLGAHYVETLRRWRQTLHERFEELASVRASAEMGRLWDFYLAYCQAAFAERHVSVVQVVLAKDGWRPGGLGLRPC